MDVRSLDASYERKAQSTKTFTAAQRAQLETVRRELTRAEAQWRDANERELPEEVHRLQAEAKREELKALMQQFSSTLPSTTSSSTSSSSSSTPPESRLSKGGGGRGGFTTVVNNNNNNRVERHHLYNNNNNNNNKVHKSTGGSGHYQPPAIGPDKTKGTDAFAAMSRHRFGTKAN